MPTMKISLIVCTYNRCQTLAKTLESIIVSRVPEPVEWEVLVVDNNSSDQTLEVVQDFSRRYPGRVRYLFERQQGLSFARNAGIRESDGEILAFTDDDLLVEPEWLWNLTSALDGGEWMGVGGRIIAVWPGPLPSWLSLQDPDTTGPFGVFGQATETEQLQSPAFGANMAFKREAFRKYGNFRTELGRSGSNLQGREDIEFASRLMTGGERLRYASSAVVRHLVPQGRVKRTYVLRWWYWFGRSEVADLGPPESKQAIAGIPLYLFHRFVRWILQSLVSIEASRRFACQRRACYVAGTAVGCYQAARSKKRRATAALVSRAQSERVPK